MCASKASFLEQILVMSKKKLDFSFITNLKNSKIGSKN